MYDNSLENAAYEWEMMKIAADEKKFRDRTVGELGTAASKRISKMTGYRDIKKGLELTRAARDFRGGLTPADLKAGGQFEAASKNFRGMSKADQQAELLKRIQMERTGGRVDARGAYLDRKAGRRLLARGAGKAAATLGVLGAAGYGANRLMSKKSSYDPMVEAVEDLEGWEFAKEAELRAAEILLANGVDPETFEDTYPEHVKLASFPDPEDAHTYEGEGALEAYNEMLDEAALDIIEELGLI